MLARSKGNVIRFSEAFLRALLTEYARRRLEDIVCKRKDLGYRSDTRSGRVKVMRGLESREPATW